MKILITIDTECDNAWAASPNVTTENAKYLPRFQALCEKYGFKVTYLTAYEMAKDNCFVEFGTDILKRNTGEIGCHPHAWHSPPEYHLTSDDYRNRPYLLEYPDDLIRQKVQYLTKLLEDTFGIKMVTHRAGRWAMNGVYAKILAENGYKVDCSVTPYTLWNAEKRPPGDCLCPEIDYRQFPTKPYYLDERDISVPGKLPILEVPVTIFRRYGKFLYDVYSMLQAGRLRGGMQLLLGPADLWFRPHHTYRRMTEAVDRAVHSSADYIMYMLHSSELMPGGSPNFRTEKDVDKVYADTEEAFDLLANRGAEGVTCFEYYVEYNKRNQMMDKLGMDSKSVGGRD